MEGNFTIKSNHDPFNIDAWLQLYEYRMALHHCPSIYGVQQQLRAV